jgi:DNA-binding NarL/FixJ family response regulator
MIGPSDDERMADMELPTVLIADSNPTLRLGIRLTLQTDFEICGEVGDAVAAVAAAIASSPDICLIETTLPGGGITAAAEIRRRVTSTTIVMLAEEPVEEELFDALRAGASGYLLKKTNPARLAIALRGALRGEAALPRVLAARVVEEFRRRSETRVLSLPNRQSIDLTRREWEVLELLKLGRSTREIAERLRISEITVRRHIGTLLRKLEVPNRSAALNLLRRRSVS